MNARSVLTLRPQEEDNDVYFRCDATNGALLKPHETMVQLSVMRKCRACMCKCVCVRAGICACGSGVRASVCVCMCVHMHAYVGVRACVVVSVHM